MENISFTDIYARSTPARNTLNIPTNMIRIYLLNDKLKTKDGLIHNLIMSMTKEDLNPITKDSEDRILSWKCKNTFKILEDPTIDPNIDFELCGFKLNDQNKSQIKFDNSGRNLSIILGGPHHANGILEIKKNNEFAQICSKTYINYDRYFKIVISKEFLRGATITVSKHSFVLYGNTNENLIAPSLNRLTYVTQQALDISSLSNISFGSFQNYVDEPHSYEDDY